MTEREEKYARSTEISNNSCSFASENKRRTEREIVNDNLEQWRITTLSICCNDMRLWCDCGVFFEEVNLLMLQEKRFDDIVADADALATKGSTKVDEQERATINKMLYRYKFLKVNNLFSCTC